MAQTATPQQLADYLVSGYWNETGSTPHQWDTSGSNVITVNITALNADGQALARAALAAWEMVADIDFRETTGTADITFDDAGSGTSANTSVSYYPDSGDMLSARVVITTGWLGKYGTTVGSYSFHTYVHEIGHALGLGHPGDYDSNASFSEAKWTIDSWQMTVMSYFDQTENTVVDATKANAATAMMADILAIQAMYGKPTSGPTAGDTIYGVGGDTGTYLDALLSSASKAAAAAFTLFDVSGTDTINFSNDARNQDVNLNPGTFSDVFGAVGNLGIAYATGIEHYKAGSGSDKVFGNNLSNQVTANGGNDAVDGNGGNDALYGGDGNDTLKSGDHNDRLEGGNGNDTLNGGNGNDKLYGGNNNDNLSGVSGNDTVDGGTGNDLLYGGTGSSTLWGGDGTDRLDAGTGTDTLYGGAGSDSFVFLAGCGRDTILGGFEDNVDTLVLDNALWGNRVLTIDQVLALGRVVNGDVVFDFGGGNTVTIDGVSSTTRLLDDIAFA